jgi:hypothetical protein
MSGTSNGVEYFVVLTVVAPVRGEGMVYETVSRVLTVSPEGTVAEIYEYMLEQLSPAVRIRHNVVCFTAGPNRVSAAATDAVIRGSVVPPS